MPIFRYTARNGDGRLSKGRIEAESPAAAASMLIGHDILVIDITKDYGHLWLNTFSFSRGVSRDFVVMFCRSLAVMNDVRPMNEIIAGMAQVAEGKEKKILSAMRDRINLGDGLAAAMKEQKCFPDAAINMIAVGEAGGTMPSILPVLADYLEKDWQETEELKSALIYPLFLTVAVVIFSLVMPSFLNMFAVMNVELPLPTRLFATVGNFIVAYKSLFLPVLLLALALFNLFWQQESFRYKFDKVLLRVPFVGSLIIDDNWAIMLKTLSILLKGDMRVDKALLLVKDTGRNRCLKKIVEQAATDVSHGISPDESFGKSKFFPRAVLQLLAAGQNSGHIDIMAAKAAEYCRLKAENRKRRLSALVQPMAVLIIGGFVFFTVLAVILPLWSVMTNI